MASAIRTTNKIKHYRLLEFYKYDNVTINSLDTVLQNSCYATLIPRSMWSYLRRSWWTCERPEYNIATGWRRPKERCENVPGKRHQLINYRRFFTVKKNRSCAWSCEAAYAKNQYVAVRIEERHGDNSNFRSFSSFRIPTIVTVAALHSSGMAVLRPTVRNIAQARSTIWTSSGNWAAVLPAPAPRPTQSTTRLTGDSSDSLEAMSDVSTCGNSILLKSLNATQTCTSQLIFGGRIGISGSIGRGRPGRHRQSDINTVGQDSRGRN